MSGFYYATDIDECALGVDNCHQRCVNTEGSFVCACSRGFSLMNDGINCARKFRLPVLLGYSLRSILVICSSTVPNFACSSQW